MFGKGKKENPIESFIGQDTVFQGTITAQGALRIDGRWEGGVLNAQGVIIGENGEAKGNINAQTVIIGGKVNGNILAKETLEIHSKAQVSGDIKTVHLSIADGAIFEGNCSMLHPRGETVTLAEETELKPQQVFLPEK